jgi:hypothetical protein
MPPFPTYSYFHKPASIMLPRSDLSLGLTPKERRHQRRRKKACQSLCKEPGPGLPKTHGVVLAGHKSVCLRKDMMLET